MPRLGIRKIDEEFGGVPDVAFILIERGETADLSELYSNIVATGLELKERVLFVSYIDTEDGMRDRLATYLDPEAISKAEKEGNLIYVWWIPETQKELHKDKFSLSHNIILTTDDPSIIIDEISNVLSIPAKWRVVSEGLINLYVKDLGEKEFLSLLKTSVKLAKASKNVTVILDYIIGSETGWLFKVVKYIADIIYNAETDQVIKYKGRKLTK